MLNSDLAETLPGTLETVLVVEGDVLLRIMISAYLKDCGYRIIQAANADEAILVLEELVSPVDVVLSEVSIGGSVDGFGLAQWIRARNPGLPVVLVGTPSAAVDAATELCNAGPTPMNAEQPEIILQRIKRLLASRRPPQDGLRHDYAQG